MAFSAVFVHRVKSGDATTFSAPFVHRTSAGLGSNNSAPFVHRAKAGVPNSFSPAFLHEGLFDPLGRIRGDQLESPLFIPGAIDIQEGDETTSPAGYVRLFAKDGNLRFVNSSGQNVNLGLLGVPLGGVIPWYPPDDATGPPESFEYADGSLVSTEGSPFLGQVKPALMSSPDSPGQAQRFVRGADASGGIENIRAPNGLVFGGSDTHTHEGFTDLADAHTHGPGNIRLPLNSDLANLGGAVYGGGGAVLISDADGPGVTDTEQFHTHSQSTHDHGGATAAAPTLAAGETDPANQHRHALEPDDASNIPAYVELAWIMKVI